MALMYSRRLRSNSARAGSTSSSKSLNFSCTILNVCLFRLHNNTPLWTVLLGQVLVEEHATISNKGSVDSGGEEKEGEDALPGVDLTIGNGTKDDVEPDIGKHRPCGSDDKHTEMFNLSNFIIGDVIHAETNDHEQVESSRSDNSS